MKINFVRGMKEQRAPYDYSWIGGEGMPVLERLSRLLPEEAARRMEACAGTLTQVRLRADRPVQLVRGNVDELAGGPIDARTVSGVASALLEHSVYAREGELSEGFFTLDDGSRVGVCGRRYRSGGVQRLGEIGSVCVRVARPVPGCADALVEPICEGGHVRSTLIVSPPGLGKTTLLRDIARQLSLRGFCVCLADERHELAACRQGVPTMDVGPRTDVMDGCPRPRAIRQMVRAMAPDVIVADEIGGRGDARALADAARCGVAVVASAHGESLESAALRPALREALDSGAIRLLALLGGRPGNVLALRRVEWREREDAAWSFA